MSAFARRVRGSAPGRYYVTDVCVGCGLCVAYAPDNFTWSADGAYCYLARQPQGVLELDAVWAAIPDCPLACIRHDGDAN